MASSPEYREMRQSLAVSYDWDRMMELLSDDILFERMPAWAPGSIGDHERNRRRRPLDVKLDSPMLGEVERVGEKVLENLIEELEKSPAWKILVNETGKAERATDNPDHPLILDDKTRQFIAIRVFPKVPAAKPTEIKP